MRIDIADAAAEQPVSIHEMHDFFVRRHRGLRHIDHEAENAFAPMKVSHRQFADDEGVQENAAFVRIFTSAGSAARK